MYRSIECMRVLAACCHSSYGGDMYFQVRSTLEILRTPMPFGSPVPDPARMTPTLAQALEKRHIITADHHYSNPLCTSPFALQYLPSEPTQLLSTLRLTFIHMPAILLCSDIPMPTPCHTCWLYAPFHSPLFTRGS